MLISEAYREQNRLLHSANPHYGVSGKKRAVLVERLAKKLNTTDVLDYGCGKGTLAASLPFPIREYDPAIPGKEVVPAPAELVICSDVLEHIEPECLDDVLADLVRVTRQMAYVLVHTGPAVKTLPDGRNTHLIQQSTKWWKAKLDERFQAQELISSATEAHFICTPKGQSDVTECRRGDVTALYHTPNDITLGRARTLFTKEPHTVKWLDSMQPGDVLFDVGANVGMYSVWAAKRGVRVYAFEPEAENYAMLLRNLALNGLQADAYCLAISDKTAVDRIYLSSRAVGRSCHSFGEEVGPDLKPRKGLAQGAVALSLDYITEMGLPVPNHIKIDVDGFEHKVILGARALLERPELKTVLVELNPAMREHQGVIDFFKAKGWYLDPLQVEKATRKSGEWKGYAEHIFHKFNAIAKYTLERIRQALVITEPFPHIYVEEVFDPRVYAAILASLPETYRPIQEARGTRGYPERFVGETSGALWSDLQNFMCSGALREVLCEKFGVAGQKDEVLLIRDRPGYAIGPHTDSVWKVLSALFYLPKDDNLKEHGTSLYVPKVRGFTCAGTRHHPFESFERVKTAPFVPNSLFAFPKSDHSFHGVAPFNGPGVRDVLLYDVQLTKG